MKLKYENILEQVSVIDLYGESRKKKLLPNSIKPLSVDYKIFGKILTVNCSPGDNYHLHHAIYKAEEMQVIVAETNGFLENGYWGEIMSTAAKQEKIGGLIINGCVRDHLQLLKLGFPIFCTGICARQSTKNKIEEGEIGGTIKIGDVEIHQGNYVAADCNGITILQADEIENVINKAIKRVEREREIIKSIQEGEKTIDLFNIN